MEIRYAGKVRSIPEQRMRSAGGSRSGTHDEVAARGVRVRNVVARRIQIFPSECRAAPQKRVWNTVVSALICDAVADQHTAGAAQHPRFRKIRKRRRNVDGGRSRTAPDYRVINRKRAV